MADEKKIGVYICSGCDIGKAMDCGKIADTLVEESSPALCKVNACLCSDEAIVEIKSDIQNEGLDKVLIGACSPRFLTDVFRFGADTVLDRVNLREQVAWTKEPNDEETQLLAQDYMRMGMAKINIMENPKPVIFDINETIMVIGGGVSGLNSALASAKAGYSVVLTEKDNELGGFYRKLYKVTPGTAPYMDLTPNMCEELIAEVESNPMITVLKNCKIESTSGQPGMFDVTASINGDEKMTFQVGSIIQATGWIPYDPNKLGYLGYGKYKNVVTNVEMEELAKNDNIKRPSDGSEVKNVVFVQCAGSRDKDHLPYCSSICCMTSLKQAMYVREKYPDSNIFIVYKDMRTPAQYEMFYKRVQNEDNIFLTKGEIAGMEESENGEVLVDVDDTLIGEKIQIKADMVVLAAGMQPSTYVEKKEEATDETIEEPKILNLTYRQGTDLPQLKYGFPDSHYICFPYETRRTGIYAAGTVRQPMDLNSAKSDALGASLKSIQILENIKHGRAVHPRSGDASYPDFFLQRCTQCKRCTEECPFSALDEDTKGTPKPNPNRCRRCGICMGACPERIISFENYSVRMISDMIKSIEMPDIEEEKPRIIAFLCENDAYPSLDIVGKKRIKYSANIRLIPVRCLGSVSTSWIADSLSQGFDGAILIGCKFGDDYQCHFIHGSELCNKRMENVQEKLKQLVLEPERVEFHTLSIDEYDKIPQILNDFADTIAGFDPNPYKDM